MMASIRYHVAYCGCALTKSHQEANSCIGVMLAEWLCATHCVAILAPPHHLLDEVLDRHWKQQKDNPASSAEGYNGAAGPLGLLLLYVMILATIVPQESSARCV